MKEQLKTVFLLTLLSGLFLVIGYTVGGRSGLTSALFMSLLLNAGAYWFSDKIVLAMHRAQPIGPHHPSGVYEIVEELVEQAALPMPKVYLIPEGVPNAFATGRNPENAAVAVTEGVVRLLDERQLRAVLAHEISHVRNRDILVSTIVAAIASAIMYLVHMLQWFGVTGYRQDREGERRGPNPIFMIFTVLLAPFVATLIQMAVSRTREFMADESGAPLSKDPQALASALQKISDPALIRTFQRENRLANMQPAFAHLYIVNHFSGEAVLNWFSTHPSVQERVRRLQAMAQGES